MKNKNNQVWVDYIRVFATFCVVFLHSAAPLLYKYNQLSEMDWWVANIYNSAVRVCVPLFFMLSGHLLLEKHESFNSFFRKRLKKVVVPLIAWSFIYIFWKSYYESNSQISLYKIYSIVLSPAYYHLWFLYAIIGIYFFLPILRVIVNRLDKKMIKYYLILWFFAVSVIPFLERFAGIESKIDLLSISGFSGYLVMGLQLGKYRCSTQVALISATIFLTCTGVTAIGTYLLTIQNRGFFSEYFYDYKSPNVIISSAVMFVLIKYMIESRLIFRKPINLSIVNSLSSASLGIYLIHAIFLYLLGSGDFGFTLNGFMGSPIYSIPMTAITAFLLSYFVTLLLKQMPLINKIVP